jgi:cysteine synthase
MGSVVDPAKRRMLACGDNLEQKRMTQLTFGPTFAEMRDPGCIDPAVRKRALAAKTAAPLDPINLYNITWKNAEGDVEHVVLPPELTGVEAPIAVISGRHFPSGSHKVGAVYSILMEKQLDGSAAPGGTQIVCPSTGNYGIGGAWVGPRMGYRSLVVLPEEMSQERFDRIHAYGAQLIKTPGCESNVKEIFDKVKELRSDPQNRILEQFSEMGNYRFHYEVTGNSILDLAAGLAQRGIANGQVSAFISAMGSAGTIAAGDRIKDAQGVGCTVGLEPIQCPTLYNVGYGGHRIEGIGDKHVTWIHHVMSTDYLMCIDDADCVRGLQLLHEGAALLERELGVNTAHLSEIFGVSGICNILGAIKTAKTLGLGKDDLVVTVATDSFDRYPSVLVDQDEREGPMSNDEAKRRIGIFHNADTEWVLEGTPLVQRRWHNQKYFTWVEQQGKSVAELDAQLDNSWWQEHAARVTQIDKENMAART